MGKTKKAAGKERKPKVRKPGKKLGELYIVSGNKIERKNKNCPKCGKGVFLGKHKDRLVCGKCKYAEYLAKE
jgi:small subunit ribosomal protein S27Ae